MAEMISPKTGDFVSLTRRSTLDDGFYRQFGVVSIFNTRDTDERGNAIPKEALLYIKDVGQQFAENSAPKLGSSLNNSTLIVSNSFVVNPNVSISIPSESQIIDPEEDIVTYRQTLEIIPDEKIPEELKARTTEFRQNLKLPIS